MASRDQAAAQPYDDALLDEHRMEDHAAKSAASMASPESVYLFYRRRRLCWQFVGYGNNVAARKWRGKVVGPFPSYVEAHHNK